MFLSRQHIFTVFTMLLAPFLRSQSLTITPNPFESRTAWSFSLSSDDTVSLNIFSSLGSNVRAILDNAPLLAGVYKDSLIMTELVEGVYFAKLETRSGIKSTLKLIKTSPVGIAEKYYAKDIVVYPNPSQITESVKLRVGSRFPGETRFSVFNSLGERISNGVLNFQQTPMELPLNLATGVYTLILETESAVHSFKVIKQRQ